MIKVPHFIQWDEIGMEVWYVALFFIILGVIMFFRFFLFDFVILIGHRVRSLFRVYVRLFLFSLIVGLLLNFWKP